MHAGGGRKYYLNRGHKFIPLARLYTTLLPYFLIIAGNGCLTLLICSPRFTYPNTIVLFYLSEDDISFHLLYHIFLHIDSNIDT